MDNDDNIPTPPGFTRYVEKTDFNRFTTKVETTFHGKNGTGGIVADLTTLKTEWVTAKNLLNWVIGGSALSLVIGLVTLAKLFNII